jgi:hypothetical protein
MHTPVLWKQIYHLSVPDIDYGMVECRGLATTCGVCRRLSVITYARTHTRTILKVYYCVYKDSSSVPNLSQMNPIGAFTSYICNACFNITILYT